MSGLAQAKLVTALEPFHATFPIGSYLKLINVPFTVTFIVNTLGLLMCLLTSGFLREKIFGTHSENCPTLHKITQCLAGRCIMYVLLYCTVLTFLVFLIASYPFLLIGLLTLCFGFVCDGGAKTLEKAAELLKTLQEGADTGDAEKINLGEICTAVKQIGSGSMFAMAGTVILVITQMTMVALITRQKERVYAERQISDVRESTSFLAAEVEAVEMTGQNKRQTVSER